MKIISINAGSSSLKFKLFEMKDESVLASGLFERIGIEGSCYTIKYDGNKVSEQAEMPTHAEAVSILLNKLIDLDIIKSLDEIEGIGHRVVTGGEKYKQSVLIDNKVIKDVEDCIELAPLHNPANIIGINAFRKALPNVKMAAVFDTAFHQTMDPVSYLYPVPYAWYEDHKVRKYGAHGTSHMYIAEAIAKELKKDNLKLKGYTLGNEEKIQYIDSTFSNSELIHGMKLTSKGFGPYSRVLTNKEIDNIVKITDEKINECIDGIINSKFDINPKKINGKNIGCEYCKFKDICFMTNKDIVELEDIKDLSFLD